MLSAHELRDSVVANTQIVRSTRPVSLLRVNSVEQRARAWRITLQRLARDDQFSPNVLQDAAQSVPQFSQQSFSYAAGVELAPAFPPRRSNPVINLPGENELVPTAVQVEIAWGLGGATPARLAADWPAMGGSLVVVGSHVDVAVSLNAAAFSSSEVQLAHFPVATGTVAAVEGLAAQDSGELSLTQQIPVDGRGVQVPCPTWGGAAYVPDFARRVKVQLLAGNEGMCGNVRSVPFTGAPPAVGVWFNDNGAALDSWVQGVISPTIYVDPQWQAVPAEAVMVSIRGVETFSGFASLHWRIGP
jgi:hypothetical protein